jgi:hypothetical protein
MLLKRLFLLAALAFSTTTSLADLFVSGQDANTIFRFDATTGVFKEKLIGPSAGLSAPVGLRVGPDGFLYIANQGGFISKYDFLTDTLSTFASPGFGATDIQFTAAGTMLVSDFFGNQVFEFDLGTGTNLGPFTTGGSLAQPTNMLIANGLLYVSSLGTGEVQRFDAVTGVFVDTYVAAGSGGLSFPAGIQFGPEGNFYVSSLLTHQIIRYNASQPSPIPALLPTPWLSTPDFSFPSDLLFDGPDLFIATTGSQGVLKFDGTTLTTFASHPDLQIAGQLLLYTPIPEASSLTLVFLGGSVVVMAGLRRRGLGR